MPCDWFGLWLVRHLERFPNTGLPDSSKKPLFYDAWRDEFERLRVTHQAAEAASRLLVSRKHYAKDHFPELLRLAFDASKATAGQTVAERAKHESQGCRDCYGEGIASVRDRETGTNFAAYCVCDWGRVRLGRAQREAKATETLIDLAAIRHGILYRIKSGGRIVTLDFTEDDDLDDCIRFLPPDLRRRAEKLREAERSESWA